MVPPPPLLLSRDLARKSSLFLSSARLREYRKGFIWVYLKRKSRASGARRRARGPHLISLLDQSRMTTARQIDTRSLARTVANDSGGGVSRGGGLDARHDISKLPPPRMYRCIRNGTTARPALPFRTSAERNRRIIYIRARFLQSNAKRVRAPRALPSNASIDCR